MEDYAFIMFFQLILLIDFSRRLHKRYWNSIIQGPIVEWILCKWTFDMVFVSVIYLLLIICP